jgi:hypothetical protein
LLAGALIPAFMSKTVKDRTFLLLFFPILLGAILIKFNWRYSATMDQVHVAVASCILLSVSMVVEAAISGLVSKVISQKLNKSYFNSGFLSGVFDCLGRGVGNILVTVCSKFDGLKAVQFYLYIIYFFLGCILYLLLVVKRARLEQYQYFKVN